MTNLQENPGCLGVILKFFGFGQDAKSDDTKDEKIFPYRLRDDFLSPSEYSFYQILSNLVGSGRVIQSKVRLADIFFVSRPNENMKYFNKISAKHIDFLVCDSILMKPLLGIELDDISHQKSSRIERDEFVDKVFEAASLPLLHVPNQRSYVTSDIADLLSPYLPKSTNIQAPVITQPQVVATPEIISKPSVPFCPKCGVPMLLRTVSQGEHKGKQFYGCANFPHCREVKPFNG